MYLRELFLREDDRSTAVFAFGRFNPPTIGHEKLINKVQQVAAKVNGKGFVFLSHTGGTAKDPIDFTTKLSYLRQHFQSDPKLSFGDIRANTIIKVMKVLEQEGRTKVIMVAGDDRVMEFQKLLNQYNGKPTKAGDVEYTFDSIQVVSAGQRDPDASDITGVSA
jgi:nicotinic acid mononucleotide adenylyltransferase